MESKLTRFPKRGYFADRSTYLGFSLTLIPTLSSPVRVLATGVLVTSHLNNHPLSFFTVTRHVEAGLIPGHTPEQLEAIEVLEQTAQRLSLHMVLKVGDIQFVADSRRTRIESVR